MRVIPQILTAALLTGAAIGQAPPASQTVQPNAATAKTKAAAKSPFAPKTKVSKPAAQTAKTQIAHAQTSSKPASQPAAASVAKHNAPVQAKAQAKPVTPKSTSVAKAPSKISKSVEAKATPKPATSAPAPVKTPEAAPAVAQSAPVKLPNPGRRDPFLSPLAAAGGRGPSANCTTGKKCLDVDQVVLKGIVQMKTGNFALVENSSKKPYVLHENDALFNGSVVKITGDSVIFKEESNDILGRPVSKEVVKKVSAPAV